MHEDLADQVARLDREVAELDRSGRRDAIIDVADLLMQKAELIEDARGSDAAIPVYQEVGRRLRATMPLSGRQADKSLVRLVHADNAIVAAHAVGGRPDEAYAVASRLVSECLDGAPGGAAQALASAAFHVAQRDIARRSPGRAVSLLDRLIERYGVPGVPGRLRTAAIANLLAGLALEDLADHTAAPARYDKVLVGLQGATDRELRRFLAEAWCHKARVLSSQADRHVEAEVAFRELVRRFDRNEGPVVAEFIGIAKHWLRQRPGRARNRLRRSRRANAIRRSAWVPLASDAGRPPEARASSDTA